MHHFFIKFETSFMKGLNSFNIETLNDFHEPKGRMYLIIT